MCTYLSVRICNIEYSNVFLCTASDYTFNILNFFFRHPYFKKMHVRVSLNCKIYISKIDGIKIERALTSISDGVNTYTLLLELMVLC